MPIAETTDNRRSFIKKASLLTATGILTLSSLDAFAQEKASRSIKRSLRIAHLTDIHLLAEQMPTEALSRILASVNSMKDKPALIINTGDTVMDMNEQSKNQVTALWNAWRKVVSSNNIPLKSCLGNHDVWYVPKAEEVNFKGDPLYGKAMSIKELNMPASYYSFSVNGWKFIALDSINYHPDLKGYVFGDQQLAWLKAELDATSPDTKILIFSHVPIISVTGTLYAAQRKPISDVGYPFGDQHSDLKQIKDLFYQYKNIKVALSGHNHYIDVVDYLGIRYQCGGAVSGNWWKGVLDEFPPAYTIMDLYEDGSSQSEVVYYRWD
ncbi:MAG: metallophosphoesterase [Pedobacter sp.]|nr:MAG: metallophosphoesterase [Pedobacter sp.]